MDNQTNYIFHIKIAALSSLRQIQEDIEKSPSLYRQEAEMYLTAVYQILCKMKQEKLSEFILQLQQNYQDVCLYDDRYVADSLLMILLAIYRPGA